MRECSGGPQTAGSVHEPTPTVDVPHAGSGLETEALSPNVPDPFSDSLKAAHDSFVGDFGTFMTKLWEYVSSKNIETQKEAKPKSSAKSSPAAKKNSKKRPASLDARTQPVTHSVRMFR
eukprot:PhM_4_TR1321/c3_g1_i5/m.101093